MRAATVRALLALTAAAATADRTVVSTLGSSDDSPCPAWAALGRYTIVIDPAAPPQEQFAAEELQHWLGNLSRVSPNHAAAASGPIITLGPAAACAAGLPPELLDTLEPDEGFVATTHNDGTSEALPSYILSGATNSSRGTLYGSYYLLRRLGLRFLAADATARAGCPAALPRFNITERPTIKHRRVESWGTVAEPLFALRAHLNGPTFAPPGKIDGPIVTAGQYAAPPGFVHTSYRLLVPSGVSPTAGPPPDLFKQFPQWFWPRGSAAVPGQLCWTNSSLIAHIIANVRGFLRAQPAATIVSVSQNDNLNYCQDEPELKVISEEGGSPSGPLLRAVNQVADAIAEEFPRVLARDKHKDTLKKERRLPQVDTLAYEYSRHPPSKTRPRPNVAIRLCNIEADFGRAMTHPSNAAFAADIAAWSAQTRAAHLHIWSYTVNFAAYMQPFPNYPPVLGENLQFFAANGVTGVFMEGAPPNPGGGGAAIGRHIYSDLEELKNYVMAEMLYDARQDPRQLRLGTNVAKRKLKKEIALISADFLSHYYGHAAPFIAEYMDAVTSAVQATNASTHTIPHPWNPCNISQLPYLTPATLMRGVGVFAEAVKAVAGDPLRRARVERASLAPLLPVLWRWAELRQYSEANGLQWPLPPTLRAAFSSFAAIYSSNQLSYFNVYEASTLDQSPLAWLESELFPPSIPTFKGYVSQVGSIGVSKAGGSVACPNKTCAETGVRLCDQLGSRCLGFAFFQPSDCQPVCAVQWYGGSNVSAEASWCDPTRCKRAGGARWNLYRKQTALLLPAAAAPSPPGPDFPRSTFTQDGLAGFHIGETTLFELNGKGYIMSSVVETTHGDDFCVDIIGKPAPYLHIRDLSNGEIVKNLTESCNIRYGSALVTTEADGTEVAWLFGSSWTTHHHCIYPHPNPNCTLPNGTVVKSFRSTDLERWTVAAAVHVPYPYQVFNTKVTEGPRADGGRRRFYMATEQIPAGRKEAVGMWNTYFFANENTDGDLSKGWVFTGIPPVTSSGFHEGGAHIGSCPTIWYSKLDDHYYVATGGDPAVFLVRAKAPLSNSSVWERAQNDGKILQAVLPTDPLLYPFYPKPYHPTDPRAVRALQNTTKWLKCASDIDMVNLNGSARFNSAISNQALTSFLALGSYKGTVDEYLAAQFPG